MPPELLAFWFEFLGWQRVLAHCAPVCKRWRQASDEYVHKNVFVVLCEHPACIQPPVWCCKGCNKKLCRHHQYIQDHVCTLCHFCKTATATGNCDVCDGFVCKMECRQHLATCNVSRNSNRLGCTLCSNGRIPINAFGDSVTCYACYGTGVI